MNREPNINYTLKADLCTGCGLCEGACPSGALSVVAKDGRFLPSIEDAKCNNSKGCSRCFDACPGVGVNLPEFAKGYFTDEGTKEDKYAGRYLKCFSGYSNDYEIRYHSASGGMVSQFLIWLLENDKIDGAIVTRFDPENPLLVKTFIATTKEDIISARSSKYAPVTFSNVAKNIKNAPGSRYVVVGIPCHIQGMRKLMAIDRKLREKVCGLFAIYCSSGRSFYQTEKVFIDRGIDRSKITYFQYRDEGCLGKMVVKGPKVDKGDIRVLNSNSECAVDNKEYVYKEHFQSYYHPFRSIFVPHRCVLCIDHFGEMADLCFGDIHIDPYKQDKIGVNSIIAKKQYWLDLLLECKQSGAITLDEIPYDTVLASQKMARYKKGRNGAFINIAKALGNKVPDYNVDYLRKPGVHDWLDYMQNCFQQFVGLHRWMWWTIPLMKKNKKID